MEHALGQCLVERRTMGSSFVISYSGPILFIGAALLWWRHESLANWVVNSLLSLSTSATRKRPDEETPLLKPDDESVREENGTSLPINNEEGRASKTGDASTTSKTSQRRESPLSSSCTRCTACRRVVMGSQPTILLEQWTIHQSCFTCRDCGYELLDCLADSAVDTSWSNGKLRFTCASCRVNQASGLHDSYASIAGERIVVAQAEHGNVNEVLGEIGDDLEQAVYFMTPRCATCGGDLRQTYNNTEGIRVVGRTVYHNHCFETGIPPKHLPPPAVKLPPSFCAKYLPKHVILKLSCRGKTLTTLYFHWPTRKSDTEQLKQGGLVPVAVPFVLDASAPANPNYQPVQRRTVSKNFRSPAKHITAPPDIPEVLVHLVAGSQVPPRKPWMPEPASVICDSDDNAAMIVSLKYLHFGLEYCLTMHVPMEGNQVLCVVDASLSIAIRDWQPTGRLLPHLARRNTDPI